LNIERITLRIYASTDKPTKQKLGQFLFSIPLTGLLGILAGNPLFGEKMSLPFTKKLHGQISGGRAAEKLGVIPNYSEAVCFAPLGGAANEVKH